MKGPITTRKRVRTTAAAVALGVVLAVGFAGGALAVTGSDTITTVAGNGDSHYSGDGGPATSAGIVDPWSVAVDADGNFYIGDLHGPIRKVDTSGTISTIVSSDLLNPHGIAADADGNVYIADTGNNRIRKRATNGTVTTFAGTGVEGDSGDSGPATSAQLDNPFGVAVDADGSVYIADTDNARIREVDANGTITTVAGNGTGGFSGDGGPATSAQLGHPEAVAVDSAGNLYISDSSNRRIRKVDTSGVITTIAGGGGPAEEGPATSVDLGNTVGIAVEADGTVYISRLGAHISKLDTSGFVTTVAGTGEFGFSGDGGPAEDAKLNLAVGVALDQYGRLYIADAHNARIRRVANGVPPTLTLSHEALGQNGWNTSAPVDLTIEAEDESGSALAGAPTCTDSVNAATAVPLTVTGSASPFHASVTGEGIHAIHCEVSDNEGSTGSDDETVKIDTHAPGITFFGAGVYTVDQTVAITCTASDPSPGSGLATNPCTGFSFGGPAYTFSLGLHAAPNSPLEASDKAGWVGGGQTSFTVTVTYASLCNLTRQFSSSVKVADSLCQQLKAAETAAAKGNPTAKTKALGAYRTQVANQSGKALTSQEAAILTQLSQAL
jgi:sugar lactone lactonase YvrE